MIAAEAGIRQLDSIDYRSTRRDNDSMMDMMKSDTGLSQIKDAPALPPVSDKNTEAGNLTPARDT